jgi:hypothetical protein
LEIGMAKKPTSRASEDGEERGLAPASGDLLESPDVQEIIGPPVVSDAARLFLQEAKGRSVAPPKMPIVSIDHQSGVFVLPTGESAEAVSGYPIYGFQTRKYYKESYKSGTKGMPPDCWSKDMIEPHVPVRLKQADDCGSCPMSKFGSGRDGRSQACQVQSWIFLLNRSFGVVPIGILIAPPSSIRVLMGTKFKPGYFSKAEAAYGCYQIVHTTFRLKRAGDVHCILDPVMGPAISDKQMVEKMIEIHNTFRSAMEAMRDDTPSVRADEPEE